MSEASREARERRFWDNYLKILHKQGIKPAADRWHVVRAEGFIRAFPGRKLADLSADDVSTYLQRVGREGNLEDWQYRQVVVAIRILFSTVKPEWLDAFDWHQFESHSSSAGCENRVAAPAKAAGVQSKRPTQSMRISIYFSNLSILSVSVKCT